MKLDLTGKTVGNLKVLECLPYVDKKRHRIWKCICKCGSYLNVRATILNRNLQNNCHKCALKASGKSRILPNHGAAINHAYHCYKQSAIERNFSFKLSKKRFIKFTKQNCHYCGISPYAIYGHYRHNKNKADGWKYNGIDRKDNKLGYTLDNSVTCCKICNRAKSGMPYEQFMDWINQVKKHLLETESKKK